MASKKMYSEKEIRELVAKEVSKANKNKGYSYTEWSVQNFFAGVLGVFVIIIVVIILSVFDF